MRPCRCLPPSLPAAVCVALLVLAGCANIPNIPLSVNSKHTTLPASAGPSLVQSCPEYQKATAAYARHDFQGALSLIDALALRPDLRRDAGAAQYLEQQRRICRHALDPHVPLNSPVHSPARIAATARVADCGPRALLLLCQRAGIRTTLADLRREAGTTAQGTTMAGLARAARTHGFRAEGVQVNAQALSQLSRPALAWVEADHYVAVLSVSGDQATIHDPNQPKEEIIPTPQLWSRCGGVLLTLALTKATYD